MLVEFDIKRNDGCEDYLDGFFSARRFIDRPKLVLSFTLDSLRA